jgi:hypothetical protein
MRWSVQRCRRSERKKYLRLRADVAPDIEAKVSRIDEGGMELDLMGEALPGGWGNEASMESTQRSVDAKDVRRHPPICRFD